MGRVDGIIGRVFSPVNDQSPSPSDIGRGGSACGRHFPRQSIVPIYDPMIRALVAFALLLAAPTAQAEAADNSRYLRYEVYWGGLHAADFVLSLERTGDMYRHEFLLRSSGFTEWLLKLDINASSQGRFQAPDLPRPESYRTDYINRWRKGLIDIRYEPGTANVTEWSDPPRLNDDDEERPDTVTDQAKGESLDPLTAFVEAVRQTGNGMRIGAGDFRVQIFDGRRRYNVVGTPLGTTSLTVLGEKREVRHLRLNTEPVAGFNGRQRMIWGERAFEVFVLPSSTPDGEPTPVRIEADGLGPVINLIAECPNRAACESAPHATEAPRQERELSPAG